MTAPLVTIGITCYNAEATIARAIDSALAQDWPAFEVVVVDDFSSDASVALVEKKAAADARVRLVRHDRNKGPAGSRNTVLAEAAGVFVAFIDDDDEALPARVRRQVERITDYEAATGAELVACYATGERRYDNGYRLPLPAIGSAGGEPPHGPAVADYLLFGRRRPDWFYGAGTPTCALMARRTTFAAVGGFDETLRRVEDADLAVRIALRGGHFIGTTEACFIQHATAAGDKSPEKNLESERRMAEKHQDYLESIGRYYYARHWPLLRYWHFKRNYGRFALALLLLVLRHPVAVPRHLLMTGPRRLAHENRMNREARP